MASAFTHGFVALSLGKLLLPGALERRVWTSGLLCSLLPDLDVVAFRFGIPYGHPLGHRGLFHSLFFALVAGISVMLIAFRSEPRFTGRWRILAVYFSAVTASHGLLDAMTSGGYGVGFFLPFDRTRYFLPWRPLQVSPIGVYGFFSRWGWDVIASEFLWVWIPFLLLLAGMALMHYKSR
jgi:inner membrane protein